MRPYLAIITDSFHSALASRVLWAAFLAIWILLLALAPIGLREDYTTTFRWFDIYNGTRMKALLAQGIVDPESQDRAIGRIAAAMPPEMQRQLRRVGEGDEVRIQLSLLTDALNEMIESDAAGETAARDQDDADGQKKNWYDADVWSDTVRLRELRALDDTPDEELSESLLRRRSRLRLEAALPGVFESRSDRSVLLTYAGLEFPTAFQIDRPQFETLFNQFVIPLLVNWLLGLVLVFLGVLVTASMIPDMLQTGSLHLLLSKPVSRSALLISKFIGGCAFVLLCVTQLVLGLFLIAGARLDVWNVRILWCIPVAVVIFAVFFSVSVLAGLKWRSAIISIAAAGALAAICMVVGVIGGVIDGRVVAPDRIAAMTVAGDDLFAVTGGSGLVRMDTDESKWLPLIESQAGSNDRVLPPETLDADHVMTARIRNGRFNPFGSGPLDLIVLARGDDWKPQPSLQLPTATERLLPIDKRYVAAINSADLLLTERSSILEAAGEKPAEAPESDESNAADDRTSEPNRERAGGSVSSWLRSLITMQGGATESFVSILPPDVVLSPPTRVTNVHGERSLVLLTGDRVQRLEPVGSSRSDLWQVRAKTELTRATQRAAYVIAASKQWIVVAQGDSPIRIFKADTLESVGEWESAAREDIVSGTPLELLAIADDLFLMRTSSGHCDVIRVTGTTIEHAGRLPVDEVESIHWHAKDADEPVGQLIVAHDVDRVSWFSLELPEQSSQQAGEVVIRADASITPTKSIWRWVDAYVIGSLELLTPKVLQLGDTTAAMVSGSDSLVMGMGDPAAPEVIRYQIAGPLVSCGVFIAVMLLIGCVYFSRSDY